MSNKWDCTGRDFAPNATVDQVEEAVDFIKRWLTRTVGVDSVKVTPWDDAGNHFTVELIPPNASFTMPVYIGTNCAANQLDGPEAVLDLLATFLLNPAGNGLIAADTSTDTDPDVIRTDVEWCGALSDSIRRVLAIKRS